MEYGPQDSSGTDDDIPPTNRIMASRGLTTTNGRTTVIDGFLHEQISTNMEVNIHFLEKEAYKSVVRAFKAQSDAITWEKESLMTDLRKELRVSHDEHRELLNLVNADDVIKRIREWRQGEGQPPLLGIPTGATITSSYKKPRISHSVHSLSLGAPSCAMQSQTAMAMQPSSAAFKHGALPGSILSCDGRGRGVLENTDIMISQNGNGKNASAIIQILNTDCLIKEVERVINSGHPNSFELDNAKRALKDHEQSLVDAISRLSKISDG